MMIILIISFNSFNYLIKKKKKKKTNLSFPILLICVTLICKKRTISMIKNCP